MFAMRVNFKLVPERDPKFYDSAVHNGSAEVSLKTTDKVE